MNTDIRLEALGLREREAKVYLASLELGPATAQQIAMKTGIQRGSAYAAIGILKKRGLMREVTKGKKQHFAAEQPTQLLQLVTEERVKLEKREEEIRKALPSLESLVSSSRGMKVSLFVGLDGLEAIQSVIIEARPKAIATNGDLVISIGMKKKLLKTIKRIRRFPSSSIKDTEMTVADDFVILVSSSNGLSGCMIKDMAIANMLKSLMSDTHDKKLT